MGKGEQPRHGSMGVWPRKRANRPQARIRAWNAGQAKGLLGFPAYKAGMTHVMAIDTRKNSHTKGETLSLPATILECPAIKLYSVRCYTKDDYGRKVAAEFVVGKDKHLARKVLTKKTHEDALKGIDAKQYSAITVTVLTQPSQTGIGKKKPEILELAIGGTIAEQLAWAQEHANKEIAITDVFKEGDFADSHGVTTGRGFQGPVKRFGIGLKGHKSEKGRRAPATLGGWSGQQHFMYRVAHAGQTGYHQRVQFNNMILKFGDKPEDVNPSGGIPRYGVVKGNWALVKGSLQGPSKRLLTLTRPMRLYDHKPLPTVEKISTAPQLGR